MEKDIKAGDRVVVKDSLIPQFNSVVRAQQGSYLYVDYSDGDNIFAISESKRIELDLPEGRYLEIHKGRVDKINLPG